MALLAAAGLAVTIAPLAATTAAGAQVTRVDPAAPAPSQVDVDPAPPQRLVRGRHRPARTRQGCGREGPRRRIDVVRLDVLRWGRERGHARCVLRRPRAGGHDDGRDPPHPVGRGRGQGRRRRRRRIGDRRGPRQPRAGRGARRRRRRAGHRPRRAPGPTARRHQRRAGRGTDPPGRQREQRVGRQDPRRVVAQPGPHRRGRERRHRRPVRRPGALQRRGRRRTWRTSTSPTTPSAATRAASATSATAAACTASRWPRSSTTWRPAPSSTTSRAVTTSRPPRRGRLDGVEGRHRGQPLDGRPARRAGQRHRPAGRRRGLRRHQGHHVVQLGRQRRQRRLLARRVVRPRRRPLPELQRRRRVPRGQRDTPAPSPSASGGATGARPRRAPTTTSTSTSTATASSTAATSAGRTNQQRGAPPIEMAGGLLGNCAGGGQTVQHRRAPVRRRRRHRGRRARAARRTARSWSTPRAPFSATQPISDSANPGVRVGRRHRPVERHDARPLQLPGTDERRPDQARHLGAVGASRPSPTARSCFNGTSAASPVAAGAAALVRQAGLAAGPPAVRAFLTSTALDRGAAGVDNVYGWGEVSTAAAARRPACGRGRFVPVTPFRLLDTRFGPGRARRARCQPCNVREGCRCSAGAACRRRASPPSSST